MTGTERDPGRWRRRALSFGVVAFASLLATVLLPLVLPLAFVRDLLTRSRLAWTRSLLMIGWLLLCECWGLAAMFAQWLALPLLGREGLARATVGIQRAWTGALMAGLRHLFSMRIELEGLGAIEQGEFIVLARHTSSADPMLVMASIPNRMRYTPHFVLKSELLWDPCLDVAGHRFPNAFIRRGAGEGERVAALAEQLGPRNIVIIYPEGTRFSPRRLARRLDKLRANEDPLLELAERLGHCLPPHSGGLASLLERAPGTDVVLFAHVGFDGVRSIGDLFAGKLIGQRVRGKLWRVEGSQIPIDADARRRWLFEQWLELDAWVAEQSARDSIAPPGAGLAARDMVAPP